MTQDLLLDSNSNLESTDALRQKHALQTTNELVNDYNEFSNQTSVPNVFILMFIMIVFMHWSRQS